MGPWCDLFHQVLRVWKRLTFHLYEFDLPTKRWGLLARVPLNASTDPVHPFAPPTGTSGWVAGGPTRRVKGDGSPIPLTPRVRGIYTHRRIGWDLRKLRDPYTPPWMTNLEQRSVDNPFPDPIPGSDGGREGVLTLSNPKEIPWGSTDDGTYGVRRGSGRGRRPVGYFRRRGVPIR